MKITPVNEKLEIYGAEMKYMGTTFIVARANNINFKKHFREVLKPYKNELDRNRLSSEIAEDLMIGTVAKTILVGWKNLKDLDGKEWEYSVANAESLLKDDKDAYEAITEFSENIDNYIIKYEKDILGKS